MGKIGSSRERNSREERVRMVSGHWRLAYIWVEGWRERLRRAGDLIEKQRFEGMWEGEIKKIEVGWLDEEVGRMGK